MFLFAIIWFVLLILSFSKQRNSILLMHFWLIFFAVIIGFRGENVGADTSSYITIFEIVCADGYEGYPEPLYGYLNFLFYQLGVKFGFFQFILFFITFEIYALVITRLSSNKIFSVFMLYTMYFVFYAMNVSRQMLAAPLLLLAYYYLFQQRRWRALMLYISAILMHISSFVSLGVLFIYKIDIRKKVVLIVLLGISFIIGAFVLNDNILTILAGPYAKYIESGNIRTADRYLQSIMLSFFWSILCYIITITSSRKLRRTSYYKLYLLSVIVSNLMMNLELGLRVVFCFSVIQIVFFPMYIESNSFLKHNTAQLMIAVFYGIFFFVFLYNNSAGILPYKISFE